MGEFQSLQLEVNIHGRDHEDHHQGQAVCPFHTKTWAIHSLIGDIAHVQVRTYSHYRLLVVHIISNIEYSK